MAQLGLYYRTQLETKVSLFPHQVDGNMDDNLLTNLRNKVEGRTVEKGLILRVNKLIDYWDGIVDGINNMGTTVFNVKYDCFVCSPTKNLEMICRVDNVVKGFIIGTNGPVIVAIQINNIDSQYFEIIDDSVVHTESNKKISYGDFIKVSVISINSQLGEETITIMCKLLSFATEEDVKAFERDQKLVSGSTVSSETKRFI